MATKCHANYNYICVTPLKYNASEEWEKTHLHLLDIWQNNNVSHDISSLQSQITSLSQSHLDITSVEDLTSSLSSSLKALNPLSWVHNTIAGIIIFCIICIILILFPCFFRIFSQALSQLQTEVAILRLKNKKAGTATTDPVESV